MPRLALIPLLCLATAAGMTPSPPLAPTSREIVLDHPYLQFPVAALARPRTVTVASAGGEGLLSFPIEAADGAPDWYAAFNVSAQRGQTLHLSAPGLPSGSHFLDNITQTDDRILPAPGAPPLYHESLRPLVHFTASSGWINDPNGPTFHAGQYHLFFQLDPASYRGDVKCWGHATSHDLIHWAEHDPAITPDHFGSAWSGSAVTDLLNTSGLGDASHPPLALIYTAAGRPFTQCLRYSLDGGQTFLTPPNNPILPNVAGDNRDPRVQWYEPAKKWVMVLWAPLPDSANDRRNAIVFLTSPNLRDWTRTSEIDGYFECPDLVHFPPTASSPDRWLLTAANGDYQIGAFDGLAFHPQIPILHSTATGTFYAAQTFSHIPAADGRVLQVGWLRGDIPHMPFNQALSAIQELSIQDTPDGPRLARTPIRELAGLTKTTTVRAGPFAPGDHFVGDLDAESALVTLDFAPPPHSVLHLTLRDIPITYDADKSDLSVGNAHAAAPLQNGHQRLTLLIDRTSVEAFASGGLAYIPLMAFPNPAHRAVHLSIQGPPMSFTAFDIRTLNSMWQ